MRRRRLIKKTPTIFRGYFRWIDMNRMVSNLLIISPSTSLLLKNVRIQISNLSEPLLKNLLGSRFNLKRKISIVDLSILHETLAARLQHKKINLVNLSSNKKLKYDQINLSQILEDQSNFLKLHVSEQQKKLKEESLKILEQERERIKQKYNSKNQKQNRR